MAEDELDFSNFDGVDELDWGDVEEELKKNKDMITSEADGKGDSSGGDMLSSNAASISKEGNIEIDFLLDIPLQLTVEVGRRKMLIRNLLEIDTNSIVELSKKIGEPLDILINGKLVARGEVIVQNEKFGLRISEIVDQKSRLNSI